MIFVVLASLLTATTANVGLFTLLSKVGKSAKKIDVDTPLARLELPENMGDYRPASIKPTAAGHWDIKLDDGSRVSFDDLVKRNQGKVKLYRPDRERSAELDQRIVPWIQSDIQYYRIISTVLGLIAVSTSWSLWNKVWALRSRMQYSYRLVYWFLCLFHRLLFITLFVPVFGYLCFLYDNVMVVVKTFNLLFVKPVRWIVAKVAR